MTIDFANKADIARLGAAVKAALDAVATEHGITVTVNGGTYDPRVGTFKPRIEFAANDSAEKEWAAYAAMYGLTAEDFGRTFTSRGRTFTLSGINTRARTAPILATCDGKTYKFSEDTVAALLAIAAA